MWYKPGVGVPLYRGCVALVSGWVFLCTGGGWYLSRGGCSFVERGRCGISLGVSVPL